MASTNSLHAKMRLVRLAQKQWHTRRVSHVIEASFLHPIDPHSSHLSRVHLIIIARAFIQD